MTTMVGTPSVLSRILYGQATLSGFLLRSLQMIEINGLYTSTVSGLAALPKHLFQALAPPKAIITQYRLHVAS